MDVRIDGTREHRSIVLNMKPVEAAEKGRGPSKKQPGRPVIRWTNSTKEPDKAVTEPSGKSFAPTGKPTDKRTNPW